MKNNLTNWIVIVVTLVVGVMFIFWHGENSLFQWLARALGLVFVISGGYELSVAMADMKAAKPKAGDETAVASRRTGYVSLAVVACAAIFVGLWMIISPATFIGMLAYLCAAMLVVYGIYQIVILAWINREARLDWWFYIVPAAFIVIGIVVLFMTPTAITSTVALLTGILLVLAAVNMMIQNVALSSMNRQAEKDLKQIEKQ